MNKRQQFVVVLATATVISGGIISFSMQAEAEADRRQAIYNEAVAIRNQREADRLKAEEPYRLKAEQERFLVEKARADGKKAKARADEAFSDYRDRHPVPDEFLKEETSDEESSEEEDSDEEASEEGIPEEKTSYENLVDEEASEEDSIASSFDWSTIYGDSGQEYETFIFTVYSEVGGENPETDSRMIKAVACAFLNNMRIYHRSPSEEAFKWEAAYSNCNCETGVISCGEGTVCWEFIEKKPEWFEIVDACWKGKAESPIPSDYNSFRTPSLMGYEYLPISVFAKDNGIDEYVEIPSTSGDGIFFREEENNY